ncbi:hypothetical protein ABFY48_00380 [Lysinibacillus pakistanensis]|uniref:hypothetical protein n=1 Tax=Lysinibacillus pakistanensis TaxID=759811 RepID=UPI003D2C5089
MRIFGMFVAIIVSALTAVGIAELYHQPYNWYLVFPNDSNWLFYSYHYFIIGSEASEENEF